jgi:hypothetical protein
LGKTQRNGNYINTNIKSKSNSGKAGYNSVWSLCFSNCYLKIQKTGILLCLCFVCETQSLISRMNTSTGWGWGRHAKQDSTTEKGRGRRDQEKITWWGAS